jgi:hypothetical protein
VPRLHKIIPFLRVQTRAIQETLDKACNFTGSFLLVLESCSLSAIKYEEKIDDQWHCECQQKLSDWAFFIDGRVAWYVGDAPYSNYQANSRKNMGVFGKPESCARPKDKEPTALRASSTP